MSDKEKSFKIVLEPIKGMINYFYAFVNGKKVIAGEGNKTWEWTGKLPEGELRIKVRAWGLGEAQYAFHIDLPGNLNDQILTFTLEGGYHEFEIRL